MKWRRLPGANYSNAYESGEWRVAFDDGKWRVSRGGVVLRSADGSRRWWGSSTAAKAAVERMCAEQAQRGAAA